MAKKEESLLGLAPISSPSGTELVPFGGDRALTRDEQRITDEWHKQTLAIEATAAKTILGQSEIAEIHKHGAMVLLECRCDGARTVLSLPR